MKLDELESIYNKSWVASGSHRAGIRAVVEALRDEIAPMSLVGQDFTIPELRDLFNEILGGAGDQAAGDVYPDGARISGLENTAPAASGSPAADHQAKLDQLTREAYAAGKPAPAADRSDDTNVRMYAEAIKSADPSPAVCEWRMVGKTFATAGCEDEYLWSHEYKVCPSCGKPIRFQEATK